MKDSINALQKGKRFTEGASPVDVLCICAKCKVSRYRHTHEAELADARHSYLDYLTWIAQTNSAVDWNGNQCTLIVL